ncbi:MAG: hypothetical protein V2B14_04560 [bacterium]
MKKFKYLFILCLLCAFICFSGSNKVFCLSNSNQNGVSLTVYNQNFALVKDYRQIKLQKGCNEIEVDNIASLIDPTSVHLKNLTSLNDFIIREQNYRYDLIDKSKILDKMVGKSIKFRNDGKILEGILLNPPTATIRNNNYNNYNTFNTSNFAIKTNDGILLTYLNDIIIDKLPEGLYARPALVWKADSAKSGNNNFELAYLTDGVNWYTDYIALIDNDDKNTDLTGWVTLNNNSGVDYNNASLKLVAGDVRKIVNKRDNYLRETKAAGYSLDYAKEQFKEESFFEYHLYSLDRKTDVKNNETKQLTLITANNVLTNKKFIYDPLRNNYYSWINQGYSYYYNNKLGSGRDTVKNQKISVILELKNSKSNNLGIALPKGKIRVYKKDSAGDIQFIGEDEIDHTPVDEKIELYIGDAFDIVGERKATDYKEYSDFIEVSFEFNIKNHKKEPVQVDVCERLFGDWSIVKNSDKYIKKDAHTIVFPVKIDANAKKDVTYTVMIKK